MDFIQATTVSASTSVSDEAEQLLYHCLTTIQDEDEQAMLDHHPLPGRPQEVPSLALWWAFLLTLLRHKDSQRSIWRSLVAGRVPHCPCYDVTDQAIYNRLEAEGPTYLMRVFARLSDLLRSFIEMALQQQGHPPLAPFAREVFALDETYLHPLQRRLPFLRHLLPGDPTLVAGKLVSLFDMRRQIWHAIRFEPEGQVSAIQAVQPLLAGLAKGILFLADLSYFRFSWFDQLTRQGFFWISRLRPQTSWRELHCYYRDGDTFDGIVALGIWNDQAAYAVRLVQFHRPGSRKWLYEYITNVCDPRQLSIEQIAGLYQQRWKIERAFYVLKCVLGLGWLWSVKQPVLLAQVWGVLIIAQIMQTLRMLLAIKAQVDPSDVSMIIMGEWLADGSGSGSILDWIAQGCRCGLIRAHREKYVQTPAVSWCSYVPLPPETILQREAHSRYPDDDDEPIFSEQEAHILRASIRERLQRHKQAQLQEQAQRRQVEEAQAAIRQRQKAQKREREISKRKDWWTQHDQQQRDHVPREQWPLPPGYGIAPWYTQQS